MLFDAFRSCESSQRVFADPTGCGIAGGRKSFGQCHGLGLERCAASAKSAQTPTHAFPDKVPLVCGGGFDERQEWHEQFVVRLLVVRCKARDQRKSRALLELVAPRGPFGNHVKRERYLVKQLEAKRVAD